MKKGSRRNVAALVVFVIGIAATLVIAGGASSFGIAATLIRSGEPIPGTPTTVYYEVVSHSTNYKLSAFHNTKYGELFRTGSSMVGKSVNEVSFLISKSGAPSGFAKAAVYNSQGAFLYYWGALNVDKVINEPTWFTFRNATAHTINAGNRIGIEFSNGDISNYLRVYTTNTDPFDGNLAYRQWWNGTGWQGGNAEDLTMVLGYTTPSGGTTDIEKPRITISSPSEGQTVTSPFIVTGSVSDNVGVSKIEIRIAYFNP
ncbi:MAG: Ig-like domain-containing protein, partial [Nitrososphaera sp.]|nr:Ig-like domain-containing protein [Nitrososphaera sp.]